MPDNKPGFGPHKTLQLEKEEAKINGKNLSKLQGLGYEYPVFIILGTWATRQEFQRPEAILIQNL